MKELKLIGKDSENRRIYRIPKLIIHEREIETLIVDPHHEENHPYMTDEKIYYLVKKYLTNNEPNSSKKLVYENI